MNVRQLVFVALISTVLGCEANRDHLPPTSDTPVGETTPPVTDVPGTTSQTTPAHDTAPTDGAIIGGINAVDSATQVPDTNP